MAKIKIDLADKYFAIWIKRRDKWTCQRCMTKYEEGSQGLQNSHFQGRRKEATRFDPLNCDALCFGCHAYFTANPAEHYQWQVARKGQDVIDRLIYFSNTYKKKDRKAEAMYWEAECQKLQ